MAAIAVYIPFIFAIIFKTAFLDGTIIYSDSGEVSIAEHTDDVVCGHHELRGAYFEMETYLKNLNETSELYISNGKIFFLVEDNYTKMYLTVNEDGTVQATEVQEQAAQFTIRTWNEQCPGGFFIDYTWPRNKFTCSVNTSIISRLSMTPKRTTTDSEGCEENSLVLDDYQSQKLFGCSDELELFQ